MIFQGPLLTNLLRTLRAVASASPISAKDAATDVKQHILRAAMSTRMRDRHETDLAARARIKARRNSRRRCQTLIVFTCPLFVRLADHAGPVNSWRRRRAEPRAALEPQSSPHRARSRRYDLPRRQPGQHQPTFQNFLTASPLWRWQGSESGMVRPSTFAPLRWIDHRSEPSGATTAPGGPVGRRAALRMLPPVHKRHYVYLHRHLLRLGRFPPSRLFSPRGAGAAAPGDDVRESARQESHTRPRRAPRHA